MVCPLRSNASDFTVSLLHPADSVLLVSMGSSKCQARELPGCPVVRTWRFHCWSLGSIPGRGTKVPQGTQGKKNARKAPVSGPWLLRVPSLPHILLISVKPTFFFLSRITHLIILCFIFPLELITI